MEIAGTLLSYKADTNAESKAGFTPLHLASQEGHRDMVSMLLEHKAHVNASARNGLTPMHLCAQEDRVNVAEVSHSFLMLVTNCNSKCRSWRRMEVKSTHKQRLAT